jgi:hypothetical protein
MNMVCMFCPLILYVYHAVQISENVASVRQRCCGGRGESAAKAPFYCSECCQGMCMTYFFLPACMQFLHACMHAFMSIHGMCMAYHLLPACMHAYIYEHARFANDFCFASTMHVCMLSFASCYLVMMLRMCVRVA